MDTEELVELADSLQMSVAQTLDQYVDLVQSGWVKLANSVPSKEPAGLQSDQEQQNRCIFLGADSKTCGIYKQRPAQCRTYPYWPQLLASPADWAEEAVVPADSTRAGRVWDRGMGGCEGINEPSATPVPVAHAYRNNQMYESYMEGFPFTFSGDDRSRLLARTDVMQGVTRATQAWVDRFVIGYQLCPFAEAVFTDNSVRYAVICFTSSLPSSNSFFQLLTKSST
jgi:Fe-S-cluster containining protein